VYTHHIGGPIASLHFIWREGEERDEAAHAYNITLITQDKQQRFFSREFFTQFVNKFSCFNAAPATMRSMFIYLTNDNSAPSHIKDNEVRERLQLIIDGGEDAAGVVADLRELNSGRAAKFDVFWDVLSEMLQERGIARVDDRRHGTTDHFSVACSGEHLHQMVVSKLKERLSNEGTSEASQLGAIPSVQWMMLQFSPSCQLYEKAARYTGRFNVKAKVQKRTLRHYHMDGKYCYALQRYQRFHVLKFAGEEAVMSITSSYHCALIKTSDNCAFIRTSDNTMPFTDVDLLTSRLLHCADSMELVMIDDKANISVGKPDCPVASAKRAGKVFAGEVRALIFRDKG
jgi:hypothetical protein